MLVFFALGLGGELRSMTHLGGGGGFDEDPRVMMTVACLMKRGRSCLR